MHPQQTSTVKVPGEKPVLPRAQAAHAVYAAVHGHAQAIVVPRPDARKIRR